MALKNSYVAIIAMTLVALGVLYVIYRLDGISTRKNNEIKYLKPRKILTGIE